MSSSARFLFYDEVTGRVIATGGGALVAAEAQTPPAGQALLVGVRCDPAMQYVMIDDQPPRVADRPQNPASIDKTTIAANGQDVATISNIAVGAAYRITGPAEDFGVITDGTLEVSTDTEGLYVVTIASFPALDARFQVTAT